MRMTLSGSTCADASLKAGPALRTYNARKVAAMSAAWVRLIRGGFGVGCASSLMLSCRSVAPRVGEGDWKCQPLARRRNESWGRMTLQVRAGL
jgi:hypothetical protein